MSAFISDELKKIKVGEDQYISIKTDLSFEDISKVTDMRSMPEGEQAKELSFMFIKEWNLKDKNGNDVQLSGENILKLNSKVSQLILLEIKEIMFSMKKEEGLNDKEIEEKKN